jgi:hypothetical protein
MGLQAIVERFQCLSISDHSWIFPSF